MLAQEKSVSQEIKIEFRTAKLINPADFFVEQAVNLHFRQVSSFHPACKR